jgi:NHL repeat-containing protein
MKIFPIVLRTLVLAALTVLAACGGGDGGGASGPAPTLALLAGDVIDSGSTDAAGAAARFNSPFGLATDSAGNVYVADTNNHTIRKIAVVNGVGVVSTLAGTALTPGHADGAGNAATFAFPTGVATDSAGNVYVGDQYNHTIRKITIVNGAGVVSTLAGIAATHGSADGPQGAATFYYPQGVAVDSAGNVFVADYFNCAIRRVTPSGVTSTFAGTAGACGHADGVGNLATFNSPYRVATDSQDNVYVADKDACTVRKITPVGVVSTIAGIPLSCGHADGPPSVATFLGPRGVAVDSTGNVYVADTDNALVRRVTPAGVVSTVVGTFGTSAFVPGALPGALMFSVGSVALGGTSLYITTNNAIAVVQNKP